MIPHIPPVFDTDDSLVGQVVDSLILKPGPCCAENDITNDTGLFNPMSIYVMASGFMTVLAWPTPGLLPEHKNMYPVK